MITEAAFVSETTIRMIVNGAERFVPDDMANADRQALAEWVASGNTIAPFVAPAPVDAADPLAVLQQALIDKGVLAQSDLTAAATSMKVAP